MTNEMKLLTALCEALGFEVEVNFNYKRQKTSHVIRHGGVRHQKRRMVTETLSMKLAIDVNGQYETELIKPETTYKLIPKHSKGGQS